MISVGNYQLLVKYHGQDVKLAPNQIKFPLDHIDIREFVEDVRRPFAHDNVELNLSITNKCDITMDFTFYSAQPMDDFSLELLGELLMNHEMIPHFEVVQPVW